MIISEIVRVCYLTHDMHPQTGIGVFSRNLIERVAKNRPDWKISVVVERKTGHPLETKVCSMRTRDLVRTIIELRRFFRNFDVVHAFDGYPYGMVAILSTLGLRKKVFITAIGTGSVRMLSHPIAGLFLRFCYQRATTVFSISRYTASKVNKSLPALKIVPIRLGINLGEQQLRPSDNSALAGLEKNKPYMLTVGTFKPRKGQKQIAQAFIEVANKLPDLKYVLEGEDNNDYVAEIKEMIKQAGLAERVYFLGSISKDQLRAVYHQADFFAMLPQEIPGDHDIEGFGLVFLDAAAAGLPIIASTEGPSAEAVNQGGNAILVDPRNIKEISGAITKLATDKSLRHRMGEASKKFAEEMSWEKMVSEYMPFYDQAENK